MRDELLGLQPDDYDVASSATPDEVRKLFRRSIAVGAKDKKVVHRHVFTQSGPDDAAIATIGSQLTALVSLVKSPVSGGK